LFALCVALQFAPPSAAEDHRGAWWLRLVRKKGGRKRGRRSRGSAKPIQEPAHHSSAIEVSQCMGNQIEGKYEAYPAVPGSSTCSDSTGLIG
jgi:hypothetical protein